MIWFGLVIHPFVVYQMIFRVLLSSALLVSSLSLLRLHQGKESLVEAVKEKILLCELFKGWSRLRFHHIVQTRVCNINDAGGYFSSYLQQQSFHILLFPQETWNLSSQTPSWNQAIEASCSDPKGLLLLQQWPLFSRSPEITNIEVSAVGRSWGRRDEEVFQACPAGRTHVHGEGGHSFSPNVICCPQFTCCPVNVKMSWDFPWILNALMNWG